jgi:ABC-type glutathione transport system ATPase component
MDSIKKLCNKCILLKEGKMVKYGKTDDVISAYLESGREMQAEITYEPDKTKEAQITKISILNNDNIPATQIPLSEDYSFEIEYEVYKQTDRPLLCALILQNNDLLLHSSETDSNPRLIDYAPGKYKTRIKIPGHLLNIGYYNLEFSFQRPFIEHIDRKINIGLEIQNINNSKLHIFNNLVLGRLSTLLKYETTKE